MDYIGRIKSFLLGLALPVVLAVYSVAYITGQTRRRPRGGGDMSEWAAVGYGIWHLGFALCIHALFFAKYDNYPFLKYVLIAAGVLMFLSGFWISVSG